MDNYTALLGTGTGATLLTVLLLLYRTLNHKRFRSRCCDKEVELSLDIDDTQIHVENPVRPRLNG